MTEHAASIVWRRLDRPGDESALLVPTETGWNLSGSAIFEHEGGPCGLEYRIVCGSDWRTRSVEVTGRVGRDAVHVRALASADGGWTVNDAAAPEIEGCVDVDLNFSPSTNLLPIRRLNLAVGEEKDVRAAWLRFPSFRFEPLEQSYRRLAEHRYLYRSAGGRFETELEVDHDGFVTLYPGFWQLDDPQAQD
jgi:hypothetical protein